MTTGTGGEEILGLRSLTVPTTPPLQESKIEIVIFVQMSTSTKVLYYKKCDLANMDLKPSTIYRTFN